MPEWIEGRRGPIRCVLFDVDGTLVDTTDLIAEGLAATIEGGAGTRPPRSELVALIGRPLVEQLRRYVEESRVAELADRFMTYYEARRREGEVLFPGALEMLDESRRLGLTVGLVTSKNRREIDGTLELLKFGDRLDCVVCSEDTVRPKPAPDPVLEAIRRLKATPDETLFVGDSVYDVRAGRGAGVWTGAALWGPFGRSVLEPEGPTYLFRSTEETTSALRSLAVNPSPPGPLSQPRERGSRIRLMNPFDPILDCTPGLTLTGLAERVHQFRGRRLLVLGDLMLDEYLWGEVHRVSPEAPVPVVEAQRHSFGLGGAANVVKNALELGGSVTAAGLVGVDSHGDTLAEALEQAGADLSGLLRDSSRPTTSKLRIVAHSQQTDQQIVRVDRESRAKIDDRIAAALLDLVLTALPGADAVLISDYNKGVLVPSLALPLLEACRRAGTPVVVNPKPANLRCFPGATLVSMNHHEALLSALSIPVDAWGSGPPVDLDSPGMLDRTGAALREFLGCETLFITHGSKGLSVFGSDEIRHLPPIPAEVYDGTGAGDTVISVAAMTLASGGSPIEAAVLGNAGGALQVHKLGAVAITARELLCLIVEGRVESRGAS